MYARRSETPCCFFIGVPTKERSSSTFLRAQRNSHIHRWSAHKCGRFSFFLLFFFSFAISFVLSFPGATKTCKMEYAFSFSRLDKSAPSQRVIFSLFFFPKKKVQTLGSFLPTKTKKIWQKYLSDPHAFLSFFTLIIQSSQNFLGF